MILKNKKTRASIYMFYLALFVAVSIAGIVLPFSRAKAESEPIGTIEAITDTQIIGWACDPDKPDAVIKISVWQYGQRASGSFSKGVGVFPADKQTSASVPSVCSSSSINHGFVIPIPLHDPTDLFYVYAQNIDANGKEISYPPIDRADYIRTSALTANPKYRTPTNDGATDTTSTKAGHTNLVATDGTYVYAQVLRGHFYDETSPTTTYPGYNGIAEIRRARLGSSDGFVTIWSKKGVSSSFAQVFIDTTGALHIMYMDAPQGNPSNGILTYVKSNNPQAASPVFINQPSPDSAACSTCRWTLLYDRATDTIHVTTNRPYANLVERRWYTKKKVTDAAWSPLELVYTSYTIKNPNGSGDAALYYYYPHLIVFNGAVHIFTTGNVYDPNDGKFRWFNGIRHFYKPIGASLSPWQSEWIDGPMPDPSITSFAADVVVTPQNKLAIMGVSTAGDGIKERKTTLFMSNSGHGDWQRNVFLPYSNSSGCFEKTKDGALHIFYSSPENFLSYAKSTDGINWQFYQLPVPAGMQRKSLSAPGCASFSGNDVLATPLATISGVTTSQTVDYSKLPQTLTPEGHTVIYMEVPSSALPLPKLSVSKVNPTAGSVTGQGISCGTDCAEQYPYGTTATVTETPAKDSVFEKWTGSCAGAVPTCRVRMDMNRNVSAAFKAGPVVPPPPPPPPTPDLVANHQTITINGALTAGKNLTFTSSIKNQGAGTASSGSIGRWCMDNTNCLDSTAGQINTHNFGAFNPNQISSLRTSNAWKASAGSHVIYWCADVTKVIAESDEKNNCASLAFTVAAPITPPPPPADLTTINLSLSGILQSGQTFTFTGNIRNIGKSSAPASKARFCVDSKNCLTSTAGRLGNDQSVPVLAAESESVKFSRTWLATAGEHTAFFCVDVTKVIAESDEKNNCSNLPFAVSEPSPPPPSCDMDMVTKKIAEAGQAMQQGNFALARQRISEATVLLQKCR